MNVCSILFYCWIAWHNSDPLTLLNTDRTTYNLPPLSRNAQLADMALSRARRALTTPDLNHLDWQESYWGSGCSVGGENLTRGDSPDAQSYELALMNSPEHRTNILDVRFTSVAIAIAFSPGELAIAQLFCD